MSIDIHETVAIDPDDTAYKPLFDNLQAGILKGHGRNHAICLIVRFGEDAAKTKAWLREFCTTCLTSASQQFAEAKRYRLYGIPGSLFVGLYLSQSGYAKLGFRDDQLPADKAFRAGQRASWNLTDEADIAEWEEPYRQPCDAIIQVADDDERQLIHAARSIRRSVYTVAESVFLESGHTLRDKRGLPIEHFGYADGLSQPVFLKSDLARVQEQQGGTDTWNPLAPLSLVLAPDPLGDGENAFGSFLVFRKLEQDVLQFYRNAAQLAELLTGDSEETDLAAAYAIGRFRDGTPVALFDQPRQAHPDRYNNFTYQGDEAGIRCPFHAHTRKVNTRGQAGDGIDRRIVRRGIPYGPREVAADFKNPHLLPDRGCGLLFMCFQSDIGAQFEELQRRMEDADAPRPGTGLDPLSGTASDAPHRWNRTWGVADREPIEFGFHNVVRHVGGEYFFAPSISFFRQL